MPTNSLIQFVIGLAIVCLIVYLVTTFLPIPSIVVWVMWIVVALVALVWGLRAAGGAGPGV